MSVRADGRRSYSKAVLQYVCATGFCIASDSSSSVNTIVNYTASGSYNGHGKDWQGNDQAQSNRETRHSDCDKTLMRLRMNERDATDMILCSWSFAEILIASLRNAAACKHRRPNGLAGMSILRN